MWASMVLVIYGALVAYTIKEGEFINALASPFFGGSPLIYSIIFLFVMAVVVYFNLNFIEKTESLMVAILISIIIFISFLAIPHITKANFVQFNPHQIFVPYGVVLFSFLGFVAIPEMKEQIKENKEMLKKAIIIGSIVPIAVYILFAFVVVGVTGNNTSDGAILGLGQALGYEMLVFGTLFGIMTMMSSFIILAFSLKKMYEYDCGINKNLSWALTCCIPLIIILLGAKSFVKTVGFSGSLAGGLMGILIALMYMKISNTDNKKRNVLKSNIICWMLIILFCLGIIYEILTDVGLIII
jgi:tyrosine-specific transport protein